MTDEKYIEQLENAVIFLSATYLKSLDAMRNFPDAIVKFPIIQGSRNTIALMRISEIKMKNPRGFKTIEEEMFIRKNIDLQDEKPSY